MARADVAHEILSKSVMECPACRHTASTGTFGRFVRDRAGLTIIECECPDCARKWKRIDLGSGA